MGEVNHPHFPTKKEVSHWAQEQCNGVRLFITENSYFQKFYHSNVKWILCQKLIICSFWHGVYPQNSKPAWIICCMQNFSGKDSLVIYRVSLHMTFVTPEKRIAQNLCHWDCRRFPSNAKINSPFLYTTPKPQK